MMEPIIEINNAIARFDYLAFQSPVSWKLKQNENWAIIGPNGGGKTLFVDILLGRYALKSGEVIFRNFCGNRQRVDEVVRSVAFRDIYSIIDTQNSYYQQRWNTGDEQDVPAVKDLVSGADQLLLRSLIRWFDISDLLEKRINLLSSGELRKFLIVKTLLTKPSVLVLDNPYIGLDGSSRKILTNLLEQLSRMDNLQLILVLSDPKDIPDMVTHILPIAKKKIYPILNSEEFVRNKCCQNRLFDSEGKDLKNELRSHEPRSEELSFRFAAILKNIHVKYGDHSILDGLDWQIERGDKWALLGPNGSGKSTLLSLICGDNPQAYANDITLFDRKRGSGESIWEIKKRIGYISPEMHLYYLKNVRCLDVVGSGFFDTIGLYRKCNIEQERKAEQWMDLFGINSIRDTSFLHVSSGEQRLVLLARVFVKNPDLLILDEPLHGLDVCNKKKVKGIIENFCDKDKSLIYVTHYEEEIPDVVDKRLVLSKNV